MTIDVVSEVAAGRTLFLLLGRASVGLLEPQSDRTLLWAFTPAEDLDSPTIRVIAPPFSPTGALHSYSSSSFP